MMESASAVRQKLELLAGARSPRGLFLSVTLATSSVNDWRQVAPTFINSEFNRLTRELELSKDDRHSLERDVQTVYDILQHDVTPRTQGLALYADGSPGVFERVELPFPLLDRVVIQPSPYVRSLVYALALMEPFVIAKVSRDESSLYVVDEWGLTREDDLTGPWLRTSDRETGEVSIKKYFAAARQDTLVEQHFKDVGASLARLIETTGVQRVVLCALHDTASAFRRSLPQATAARVVAEIPYDPAITPGQMLAQARAALQEARNNELGDLATRIRDFAASGGRGAAGFDDVLGALGRGQVQTLLVQRDYRAPGWLCGECSWMSLARTETCPACGARTFLVEDAVSELIRLAVLQSSQIEVGEDLPVLADMGGVAALLRYA